MTTNKASATEFQSYMLNWKHQQWKYIYYYRLGLFPNYTENLQGNRFRNNSREKIVI